MRLLRPLCACVVAVALGGGCDESKEPDARFVSIAEIKGFDPVFTSDGYASSAQFQVYEGLVEFHPWKRPFEIMPCLATEMPEESPDHLVYTFKIRDDAWFQDHDCFPDGKGRKVTAQDFVWCMKRLMAIPSSQISWIWQGKVKGLDDWAGKAGEKLQKLFVHRDRHYPFESPEMREIAAEEVPGFRAVDDHTLRVELSEPYPQFLMTLTMFYVYPHEAVERYGVEFQNHPVGCGPYRVDEFWYFDHKITFVRSPTWHGQLYPGEGTEEDRAAGRLADAGKPLPFLDRVELVVIPESQPRWLEFVDGRLEVVEVEREIFERAMTPTGELRPDVAARGVRCQKEPRANLAYTGFNMDDPILGQPAGEKGRKLRQAMSLAYDVRFWIRLMRNGHWGVAAANPIPPSIIGYVDERSPYARCDIEAAKRLLAEAGYPNGGGLPELTYEISGSDAVNLNGANTFKNAMAAIGIKVALVTNTWDQFLAKLNDKKAQIFGLSYSQDYPDAQDFLALFYGPNESPNSNNANYKNPEYDALYKRMSVMQPSPERDAVTRAMLKIVNEDCPWIYQDVRTMYSYCQPWISNVKYSEINQWQFKYAKVDAAEKARRLGRDGKR